MEACPAFSTDGRRLAYGRASGTWGVGYDDASLVVADVDLDGSIVKSVDVPLDGVTIPPCAIWSSDGRHVAFGVRTGPPKSVDAGEPWPGRGDEVWVVNLDTMEIRRLAALGVTDLEWSPDGTRLAIAADGIMFYAVPTDDVITVGTAMQIGSLSWSPDGAPLAYERATGRVADEKELWVMDADGSDTHLIATGYQAITARAPSGRPTGPASSTWSTAPCPTPMGGRAARATMPSSCRSRPATPIPRRGHPSSFRHR